MGKRSNENRTVAVSFCTVSSNTYVQCSENIKNGLMTDTF